MNKADSYRLSRELNGLGLEQVTRFEEADVVILNSCVIRKSAEDKVVNKLSSLVALKRKFPGVTLVLTGCLVDSNIDSLRELFPHVDFFLKPQQYDRLLKYAGETCSNTSAESSLVFPEWPSAFIPIINGCNNFCSYCIVPYRRGREKSRPAEEIIREAEKRVKEGVREITLLGQNVDSYGHDLPDAPTLADLLTELNGIENLARIRFLTSHPKDMTDDLIDAVASLDKVCEHLSLPAQSGDNEILSAMRRGYSIEQYIDLIERIRYRVPDIALSNDIIAGFPGETEERFQRTFDLLEGYRFDTVHVAAYSPRPGTIASRKLEDDVPLEEKQRRLKLVEELQQRISREINESFLGKEVDVLVDGRKGGRWQGRSRGDKPVFLESDTDCPGKLIRVRVDHVGPWSLQGKAVGALDNAGCYPIAAGSIR